MEKLASRLTNYLVRNNTIDEKKVPIYQYGFQMGLEVCFNTVVSIIIGILCKMVSETVLFFIVFMLLRAYAGGLHLNTYFSCFICSSGSLFLLLLLAKNTQLNSTISILITLIALILVKVLSPVLDINRPINERQLKQFSKNLTYSIIGILFVAFLFYFIHYDQWLYMIAITTVFMDCILVLGKLRYKKQISKQQVLE